MSRVWNSDEFLERLRELRAKYKVLYQPLVANVRAALNAEVGDREVQNRQMLEAHARRYFIDGLLQALNWNIVLTEGNPNLVPEAPVRSVAKNTICFLDYFGLERQTGRPMLVVETKHPSIALPTPRIVGKNQYETLQETLCAGLGGTEIPGGWQEQLKTLRDYVRSITHGTGASPKRVVSTNGKWLIVFLDPVNAFIDKSRPDPLRIVVCEDQDEIQRRYAELFGWLDYHKVLGFVGILETTVGQLRFHLTSKDVNRVMYGIRVRYSVVRQFKGPVPMILVRPVLLIRSRVGVWLAVDPGEDGIPLPRRRKDLVEHLRTMHAQADSLLRQVNEALEADFRPVPITAHYADKDAFELLKGVTRIGDVEPGVSEYLIATGNETHFLKATPTVPKCPYHDWARSNRDGAAAGAIPVVAPWTDIPRSFFISGENQHCAHQQAFAAKNTEVSDHNRDKCGVRSKPDHGAFCELIPLESHLCCRTCVFEDVCTKAEVFRLPCHRPEYKL